jgi:rhamnosyl/mannosyltransferase
MKILHFYKTYSPDSFGGTQSFIRELAQGCVRAGHEVDVLFLSRNPSKGAEPFDNHTIHRARLDAEVASTGLSFSALRRFKDCAREADIIHYHFPWPFMDVVHFAARLSKPSIVTYHSDIVRQRGWLKLYQPLMRRFLGSIDRIVATSPAYLETSEVLRRFKQKSAVIPIGIDRSGYPEPSADTMARWRARFGERFFLFVGALRYYKGLHVLLEALTSVDYPVVIVGSGPLERELQARANELHLSHVHFLGTVPEEDKVALLKLCYGMVFPSHLRSEAFGITLLEGAMFGKPMISCEIGTGTTFINVHGETGLVVAPGDASDLSRAMTYLFDNPETAAKMGQKAEQRYEALFRADTMVSNYLDLYEDVLARRRFAENPTFGG